MQGLGWLQLVQPRCRNVNKECHLALGRCVCTYVLSSCCSQYTHRCVRRCARANTELQILLTVQIVLVRVLLLSHPGMVTSRLPTCCSQPAALVKLRMRCGLMPAACRLPQRWPISVWPCHLDRQTHMRPCLRG